MNWQLPELRQGRPPSEELAARRKFAGGAAAPTPDGVVVEELSLDGVRCLAISVTEPEGVLVYFHGGGYRMGAPEGWLPLAAALSVRLRCQVTLPDYRLAPENPFPAALFDAVAVYGHASRSSGRRVLLGGDSAGGGLAAAVTVACAMNGNRLPDALFLLSPWLDLTLSGESFTSRSETDRFFPPASAAEAVESYLQGFSANDPLVSPLFAELTRFPPTLLFAGTEETLLDDSVRFAERLAKAGRTVSLEIAAGMQHAWPVTSPDLPESSAAIDAIDDFVERVLAAGSSGTGR